MSTFDQIAILVRFPLIVLNRLFLLNNFFQNVLLESLGVLNHSGLVHKYQNFLLTRFQRDGRNDAVKTSDYKIENEVKILNKKFLAFSSVFLNSLNVFLDLF
jgi:hypothetical protein